MRKLSFVSAGMLPNVSARTGGSQDEVAPFMVPRPVVVVVVVVVFFGVAVVVVIVVLPALAGDFVIVFVVILVGIGEILTHFDGAKETKSWTIQSLNFSSANGFFSSISFSIVLSLFLFFFSPSSLSSFASSFRLSLSILLFLSSNFSSRTIALRFDGVFIVEGGRRGEKEGEGRREGKRRSSR